MHFQANIYFGLIDIWNINTPLQNPLAVSALQKLAINPQEIQNFYDGVSSDIIYKEFEGSITNT